MDRAHPWPVLKIYFALGNLPIILHYSKPTYRSRLLAEAYITNSVTTKFLLTLAQMHGDFLGSLKTSFLSKNCCGYFLGNTCKILVNF